MVSPKYTTGGGARNTPISCSHQFPGPWSYVTGSDDRRLKKTAERFSQVSAYALPPLL